MCLTWAPGTAPADIEAVRSGLEGLAARIPEIRAYAVGPDAGAATGNADFGIVADFDDVAAWRRYQDHPEHQRVLIELIRPHLAARTAIQFEVHSH